MKTTPASFTCTPEERELIRLIAERAVALCEAEGISYDRLTASMDLSACHCNGMPLDFGKLLDADSANFGHDVLGIRRHISRKTGELVGNFVPRCARPADIMQGCVYL